jgi:chemoreceptor zinc-binding protein
MPDVAEQITRAIAVHGQWRARLTKAIAAGASEFDVATVRRDDKCEFGSWLHHSIKSSARASARYARVRDLHAQFHLEAARVLALAVSGHKSEADYAMGPGGAFSKISAELTSEMASWQSEAA